MEENINQYVRRLKELREIAKIVADNLTPYPQKPIQSNVIYHALNTARRKAHLIIDEARLIIINKY